MPSFLSGEENYLHLCQQLQGDPDFQRDLQALYADDVRQGKSNRLQHLMMFAASTAGQAAEMGVGYVNAVSEHLNDRVRQTLEERISRKALQAVQTLEQITTAREFCKTANEMLINGEGAFLTTADANIMSSLVAHYKEFVDEKHMKAVRQVHALAANVDTAIQQGFASTMAGLQGLDDQARAARIDAIKANAGLEGILRRAGETNANIKALLSDASKRRAEEAVAQSQLSRDHAVGEAIGSLRAAAAALRSPELAITANILTCASRMDVVMRSAGAAIAGGGLACISPFTAVLNIGFSLTTMFANQPDPAESQLRQLSAQLAELRQIVLDGFHILKEHVKSVTSLIQQMERNLSRQLDRVCDKILVQTIARLNVIQALNASAAAVQGQNQATSALEELKDCAAILDIFRYGRAREQEVPTVKQVALHLETCFNIACRSGDPETNMAFAGSGDIDTMRSVLSYASQQSVQTSDQLLLQAHAGILSRWIQAKRASIVVGNSLQPSNRTDQAFLSLLRRTVEDLQNISALARARNQHLRLEDYAPSRSLFV